MRILLILMMVLFSVVSFAQNDSKVTCDVTDTTGEIQIGISYTITMVSKDVAYLDAGSHLVKLKKQVVGGIRTPFYVGEDTRIEFTLFDSNETLLFLKIKGSGNEPVIIRCQY